MKFGQEIGIDLGTANILVFVRSRGIILNEPSVVAIDTNTRQVKAVGAEARQMLGRTPGNIVAIRPMSDGVIAEYTTTVQMLRYLIQKSATGPRIFKPRVLVCVPAGVTSVERRAVEQAAMEAGAREVATIEETMAAAIGAGLPIESAGGNMVVDIGGGTTDIAVISLGGIVTSQSIRVGGNKMDEVIVRHIGQQHGLIIGDRTAEEIKIEIGSAYPSDTDQSKEVKGRDRLQGLPKTILVTEGEIREALSEPVSQIITKVKSVLEHTPPELSSDIIERGITLTGGGSLLRGLDQLISLATGGIPTRVAGNTLECVVLGTGKALEEFDTIRQSRNFRGSRN
ncbi:MAG: rod shape-determining protein [Armatimonadota bacterium]